MAILSIQENLDRNLEKVGTYANKVYPTLLSTYLTKRLYNQKVPKNLEEMLDILNRLQALVVTRFKITNTQGGKNGTTK